MGPQGLPGPAWPPSWDSLLNWGGSGCHHGPSDPIPAPALFLAELPWVGGLGTRLGLGGTAWFGFGAGPSRPEMVSLETMLACHGCGGPCVPAEDQNCLSDARSGTGSPGLSRQTSSSVSLSLLPPPRLRSPLANTVPGGPKCVYPIAALCVSLLLPPALRVWGSPAGGARPRDQGRGKLTHSLGPETTSLSQVPFW